MSRCSPKVINASIPPRSYWPVALASTAVTQQLSCVIMAAAVPLHLHAGRMSAHGVLIACVLLMALGYGTCALLGGHLLGGSVVRFNSVRDSWVSVRVRVRGETAERSQSVWFACL
ncbi:hypothetical protein VaNZ11_006700 [Volvox africanus]|uniref:Amino acid transporter transmembrane domain-containing protein n=1 Tax=Volvox africanus TaxID=51714 RepID=A0ABQ5S1B2_9CHLO|nr:hypothetical protein VaNZ11_006700 [Volvox africanus]